MRRLLSIACALLFASAASGQQVKSRPAGFEEFRTLLEQSGYKAFSFDLREFLSDRYDMVVRIREYVGGKCLDEEQVLSMDSNKRMVSDFPAESQARIEPGEMVDPATRTYAWAESLTVGFYPSDADSLANVVLDVPGMMTRRTWLKLHGLTLPDMDRPLYRYRMRPFRLDGTPESGEFIPLVFVGSMWYDAKRGIFRFCGDREIAPDLSSEIVGNVPHFFVIGLELTHRQDN